MRDVATLTHGEELRVEHSNHDRATWGTFAGTHEGFVILNVGAMPYKFPLTDALVQVVDLRGQVVGVADSDPPILEGAPPELE